MTSGGERVAEDAVVWCSFCKIYIWVKSQNCYYFCLNRQLVFFVNQELFADYELSTYSGAQMYAIFSFIQQMPVECLCLGEFVFETTARGESWA